MGVIPDQLDLARLTTDEFARLVAAEQLLIVLLPVGAIEPHGPHLPLSTDVIISAGAAVRAAGLLASHGMTALIAPPVPYGVTRCATGFAGAISAPAPAVTSYISGVIAGFLDTGVDHVCVINNHLEPAHNDAVRAAIEGFGRTRATMTSPLVRRWARTLSDEFKSGACHAGEYESSLLLATTPDMVRDEIRRGLPAVPVSLSEKLNEGITTFREMGMDHAYAGAPARASAAQGDEQLDRLASMIATEIFEALE